MSNRPAWRSIPSMRVLGGCACVLTLSLGLGHAAEGVELRLRAGRPADAAAAGARELAPGAWQRAGELRGIEADTVRLAVLLVEFPADTDPATTGDGRFEREFDDTYATNRPPHDQAYFDLQCLSVARYFDAATSGRLDIDWTIFPAAAGTFFEMPQRMRYYNPDTTAAALDRRLAEFFRDAVTVADQGGVPFSDYDYTVIFHAGVGQDLLIAEDTPSDIPSAFISLEELREALGHDESWMGVPVEGGAHAVPNGLWLPETENQEGIEFGITGVFAQLMGSQLGLPILFNPDSGAPGIGRFGLMDQGGGNLLGDVPALPSAWERFDRGWADAIVVTNAEDVAVVARGVSPGRGGAAELIVVPIDEREYFLIENRKKELDGNGELELVFEDPGGSNVPAGVVADEYDYGIPGSGLLIWHIDQQVIDAQRDENRVNADFTHRGVKLLEADGLDDIGLRPEGGFGLPEDAFYAPNNTALTPSSNPSSRSNYANANTHVFITSISDTAVVMTFDVANDLVLEGDWPNTAATSYQALPPASGDLAGSGEALVMAVDRDSVRVLDAAGTAGGLALPPDATVVDYAVGDVGGPCGPCEEIVAITAGGGIVWFSGSGAPRGGDPLPVARALAFGPADADPGLDLLVVSDEEVTAGAFGPSPLALALPPAFGTPIAVTGTRGVLGPYDVAVTSATGAVFATSLDMSASATPSLAAAPVHPPVFGDLDRDGTAELVAVCEDGLHAYALDGTTLEPVPGWPVRTEEPLGPPALGDVDADGRVDVLVGGANRLHAFGPNGVRLEGWPVTLSAFDDAGNVVAEPVIADVNGDGRQDVILASPDGLLRVLDGRGRALDGFPVPAGRTHVAAASVSAIGGGAIVVAGAGTSYLYAFSTPGAAEGAHWPGARGGPARNAVFDATKLGELVEGGELFPEERLYVYPNPAHELARFRYYLGEPAEVEVAIYDVSGLEITRLRSQGQGGVMNEIAWNLRNADRERIAPGLYVARLVARGTGGTETLETKVAVYR